MKVKICGITNLADAITASDAGANYLGFIFYPKSPRSITPELARDIIANLQTTAKKVGVFVNATINDINSTVDLCGLDIIQLHGEETAEFAQQLDFKRVWKAFHITSMADIEQAAAFPAAAILVDTATTTLRGGTGKTCDWQLATEAAAKFTTVLAGGITPANIREAINKVKPFAIDVASGVEVAPGIKEHNKIRQLFEEVRRET